MNDSISLTFLCYNETDNVCVESCGYLQDPDCSEPEAVTIVSGGGGGAASG